MKTVFVTGGAGFIGSNFVRQMLTTHPDYKIINVDALTYAGNLENYMKKRQSLKRKNIGVAAQLSQYEN